jgi:ABC-type uncharacterized transport system substrate-binding protein
LLVVMSYDEKYAWEREIREGIEKVLSGSAIIKYVYMDTKNHLQLGPEKAKEAFEIYQNFQPDGVIAADDNAQSMFVVPYLKDKVPTPVMFCGVNAELEEYGYPASNVSGIIERLHVGESLTFAQQLVPEIKRVIFMQKSSPSGRAFEQQFNKEAANYPVESVAFLLPETLAEAKAMLNLYKDQVDALFYETMEGLPDEQGKPMHDKEVIPLFSEIFKKPIISNNLYHVEYGSLCAVIKSGQEQGEIAASKLLEAMQARPLSEIPVARNFKGQQALNVTVMDALGIKPKPFVLKGVKLIKTVKNFKVLVVMSYEEDFDWVIEVRSGIEAALGGISDIEYFYMNTKTDLAEGPAQARKAYEVYQRLQPDGVITVDDNAQSMFVLPYLKDRVKTPVIFCGVNAEPSKYGYPASNVSGVLERGHIKESIAFLQELVPHIEKIVFMAKESPTGRAVLGQAESEAEMYSVQVMSYLFPKTFQQAKQMATRARDEADVMFLATMQGISGEQGEPLSEKEVIPEIARAFGKPIISDNSYDMRYGMLCAIVVSGEEQGLKAGKQLLEAMKGTSIDEIPIIRNDQGRRLINVTAMKALGIKPKPSSLVGVELIRTEK